LLPDFRRFAVSTRAIDQVWSTSASTNDQWTPTGIVWGNTENRPLQVANAAGLLGVQKPGRDAVANPCTAATEKIVADLAHHLRLPVPPVTLWDRGASASAPRFVAVSAWAYESPLTWGQADPGLSPSQRAALLPWASVMLPFESWIDAQDRHNPGNMLVSVDAGSGETLGAWIDYAFSLDHVWKGNHMNACNIGQIYPPIGVPMADVMIEVADRISAVENGIIEGIVNRIPSTYLPRNAADTIIHNLQSRRANVRAAL
jgi:hypothetical protein